MKREFQTAGAFTYLTVELGEEDIIDSMSLGMLTNNSISGFAATTFTQMDQTRYIKYNVSAMVSAKQVFSGPVSRKRLLGILDGIVNALISAEDYMLDPKTVLLDLEYIFTDVSSGHTELICLPVENAGISNPDPASFFKGMLFTTQFDQTENCDHVAQLLNYLNSNPVLSLEGFQTVLKDLAKAGAPKVQERKPSQPQVEDKPAQQPARRGEKPVQDPISQQRANTRIPAATHPNRIPQENKKHEGLQFGDNYKRPGDSRGMTGGRKQNPGPEAQPEKEQGITLSNLFSHFKKDSPAKDKGPHDGRKPAKDGSHTPPQKKQPDRPQSGQRSNPGFEIPGQQKPLGQYGTAQSRQNMVEQSRQARDIAARKSQGGQQPVQQPLKSEKELVQEHVQQTRDSQNGRAINFGETMVLNNGMGETMVLDDANQPGKASPHLIRVKNNEKVPVTGTIFRIGKERSYVDYFIGDNTAISRSHANIVMRNGDYFIIDTNSTNHTYVNGGMIRSNEEVRLSHGTRLRLANEDFVFKMY